MKTIFQCLVAIIVMLVPLSSNAREDTLAHILDKCLHREMVSPDSIEYNLQLLESERQKHTGVRRAVYTACLAQLYAMRAYSDVTGEWRRRSVQLFRESLSDPLSLYQARTSDWIPVVKRGKDEDIYGSNMLYVIWCSAYEWAGDSVMSEQQLIDFYAAQGNQKPRQVRDEIHRMQAANDSIWKHAPRMKVVMSQVYYPGDSLRMKIDSSNVKRVEWKLRDAKGRLLGVNVATAPTVPGRYRMEVRSWTDARLRRPARAVKIDFVVSRLQTFVTSLPGQRHRITIVDARTGEPLPQARGILDKKKHTVRVTHQADSCLPAIYVYGHYNYNPPARKYLPRTAIYTDRNIYRPGQQIQLSAVLYEQKHWHTRIRPNHQCEVKLLSRDNVVLADTTVATDDMGVLSATLPIPQNVELGWHTISVDNQVQAVKIEEYKRPSFYVEIDRQPYSSDEVIPLSSAANDTVQHDSTITVTGRAVNYDGTPVRGARVTSTSSRICCWWWRGRGNGDFRHLDTVYTDMEGRFSVSVPVSREHTLKFYPTLRVEVSVLSLQGETQTDATSLRLFPDPPQQHNPNESKSWIECPIDTFDTQAAARLELRSVPGEKRNIFLLAFAGETVVMDTLIPLTDTLRVMDIPYEERYGDGIRLLATYVLHGEVHSRNIAIHRRLPRKTLSFHWDTFRDHTRPGATQQWTLRITDAQLQPVRANVMIGMYDSSLDAFGPHRWSLLIRMNHNLPYAQTHYDGFYRHGSASYWQNFEIWTHNIQYPVLSHLDVKYFQQRGHMGVYGSVVTRPEVKKMHLRGGAVYAKQVMNTMAVAERMDIVDDAIEMESTTEEISQGAAMDEAFEAVQVRGDFSETAMFQPHLRTDAQGRVQVSFTLPQSLTTWTLNALAHTADLCSGVHSQKIVARKVLATKIHLPRFVRERDKMSFTVSVANTGDTLQSGNMQVLVSDATSGKVLLRKRVRFSVEQDRDSVYTFSLPVAEGLQGLTFKAVAIAEQDSDGEQREIPVLSSVTELTESKALTLQPGQSERIDLSSLFPRGAENRRVIVEKVLDPVQTAIDALPSVAIPQNQDVLSYATAYYAADRLEMADTLFLVNKLYSMQKPDGGMPWFDGFASSPYLTHEVGYLLARLHSDNPTARKVLGGIKRYLVKDLQTSIAQRQKYNQKWTASLSDLRTLYILVSDHRTDKEMLSLARKVMKRVPQDLQNMDSEYIAIAMIVRHCLDGDVLQQGVKTLATRLHHQDGEYLAYRGGNWHSIDRRLHIHTQVMEAWQMVCPQDTATIRGMQYWLLAQKRTQGWRTAVDCIDAVFALTGGDISKRHAADLPAIERDTIDLQNTSRVAISNDASHPIWAAVFAQYTLPIEEVQGAGMDITLERSFSVTSPRVGDRITEKVLIDVKRDYEYLVLSVPRSGAAEPVSRLSGNGWQGGVGYYMQVRDDRTDYFIPSLPHGKYLLETDFTIERKGAYSTGVPTIRCCYAEEFRAHARNIRMNVE